MQINSRMIIKSLINTLDVKNWIHNKSKKCYLKIYSNIKEYSCRYIFYFSKWIMHTMLYMFFKGIYSIFLILKYTEIFFIWNIFKMSEDHNAYKRLLVFSAQKPTDNMKESLKKILYNYINYYKLTELLIIRTAYFTENFC